MARNRCFRFLSWNVRGLNGRDKCASVKLFIKKCKCGVVCLQETKLANTSNEKFFTFCGYHLRDFCVLNASGSRGGLLTAWNSTLFECVDVWTGRFSITTVFKRRIDGAPYTVSNIYGPSAGSADRAVFFQELRALGSRRQGAWVLMGDFNVTLSSADKNGPLSRMTDTLRFREVVDDLEVMDLPILNKQYTWTNGQPSPIMVRLDRALISREWQALFPRSALRALSRPRSDHNPILLSAFTFWPASSIFRFEAYWLRHPGARQLVASIWDLPGTDLDPARNCMAKLQSVAGALKVWSTGLASALTKQSDECLKWIEWIDRAEDQRPLRTSEGSLRVQLKLKFDEISLQTEIKWRQRSRVQWLKEGDANTRFFHLSASARKSKNHIASLKIGNRSLNDHGAIAEQLFGFFTQQLGVSAAPEQKLNFSSLYPEAGPDLQGLEGPFNEEEIKIAVFSLAPDKAPGPDGFPIRFYQHFWSSVKGDLLAMFAKLFDGSLDLGAINQAWICLIPKKDTACEVRDFRPICLTNGISKIIAKVLASRLQGVLGDLINRFQTAFIKGRSLSESFITAQVFTHFLHSSNRKAALLKIDFERAFDQIAWPFLFDVLGARGFGSKWIGWIKGFLLSSSSAVLLNGAPGKFFNCRKGLRQGDPLSPMLFILCVDVFYRMMHNASESALLPPIGTGTFNLHTLQYADDLLIFLDGSSKAALLIHYLLNAFSNASGLRINFKKSSIFSINLTAEWTCRLSDFFGCPVGSFPFTYLGLPLSPRALNKAHYMPLIEKVGKRLGGWKGALLSRGGRLVLLNSVLSAIPIFFCMTFRLPTWAIKEIDRVRRNFFWRGAISTNGLHCLVKWEHVCRPKEQGGLGVKNLSSANAALLLKNLWLFFQPEPPPWARLLRELHYKRRSLCHVRPLPVPCSPFWRGVLGVSAPFFASINFDLGDGAGTPFWHASWGGNVPLRTTCPTLFADSKSKHLSVSSWWSRFRHKSNYGFNLNTQPKLAEYSRLTAVITATSLSSAKDRVCWRWSTGGDFSVRGAYNLLSFDGINDTKLSDLWSIRAPTKIKIFMWLGARSRIPTADLLMKRGWIGPTICPLCSQCNEWVEHLFFECPFARDVWRWLLGDETRILGKVFLENGSMPARWDRIKQVSKGNMRKLLRLGFVAGCWEIWRVRNDRIFNDTKLMSSADCGMRTVDAIRTWMQTWGTHPRAGVANV